MKWSGFSFKRVNFSDPLPSDQKYSILSYHEDVGCVPPRFSRENPTFMNNPRSQRLNVLFQRRINQIWPAQSSHCLSNEISLDRFSERMMIIRIISG
jgi:hypothetical protein